MKENSKSLSVETPLTNEQRGMIYHVIFERMLPDDRYPSEVIADRFKGSEDNYLRTMAAWHDVPLEPKLQPKTPVLAHS